MKYLKFFSFLLNKKYNEINNNIYLNIPNIPLTDKDLSVEKIKFMTNKIIKKYKKYKNEECNFFSFLKKSKAETKINPKIVTFATKLPMIIDIGRKIIK